ncbi:hypothetical protein DHW03_05635 [Pedobacter yonginense]|uniref:Uncharacterized protein n=1 Tax=Pedobacter yonginense TaxID=651869 RepID=A0A317EVS5_9SPHI|nr:hypothetical protein DHW03_05635 [Pedobacter yonginense]
MMISFFQVWNIIVILRLFFNPGGKKLAIASEVVPVSIVCYLSLLAFDFFYLYKRRQIYFARIENRSDFWYRFGRTAFWIYFIYSVISTVVVLLFF